MPGTDARPRDDRGAPGGDLLRSLTPARVGLGRAGGSVPTGAHLAFRADHARARDAVHHTFDGERIVVELETAGRPSIALSSAATSRGEYIRRPDLGRTLSGPSAARLGLLGGAPCDLAIVLCDGLSPHAVERHGRALAIAIVSHARLRDSSIGVIAVVTNGRVAIGDHIGAALGARMVVVLIGERPGLTVPESIGAYVTIDPKPGRSDAERNCVSNIHERGLSVDGAARQVVGVIVRAQQAGVTGVELFDDDPIALP
ncbi:MAG: ethanolamine ammonia-lyase subunit EutC [Ilumatobacteraceae bacterium]